MPEGYADEVRYWGELCRACMSTLPPKATIGAPRASGARMKSVVALLG
jgi:hypothetical protein